MAGKKENYSVLMSVYEKEKPDFLHQSMQSIYNQTIPTNDFVLICDGPLTEGLENVIKKMQKKFGKRLRVVRLEKNVGLGNALKVGIEECRNELIARMDSDDVSEKDRIEKQLKKIDKTGVDVIGSNIAEYDENMVNITGRRVVPTEHENILKMMKTRNGMNHVTVVYKKSKVLDSGNYLDMPGFEDYYLWVRMMVNGCSFYNIQEDLVKVRCGDGMIGRRGGNNYIKNTKRFERTVYEMGFISYIQYLEIVVGRFFVSAMPNKIRSIVYKKALRK